MEDFEKKYKGAMEVMRQWKAPCHTKEQLSTLKKSVFPEIEKYNDERIRKILVAIIQEVKGNGYTTYYGEPVDNILAYLEKQKEPTFISDLPPDDKGEPGENGIPEDQKERLSTHRFRIGDKVHWPNDDVNIVTITGFRDDAYLTDSAYGPILFSDEMNWELAERNPANDVYPEKLEDAIKLYYETYGNGKGGYDYMSYTKFEDIVKTFVNDYGCQKYAEWSEEDEKTIVSARYYLNKYGNHIADVNVDESNKVYKIADALFSLRTRLKVSGEWKPNKEQMDALDEYIYVKNPNIEKYSKAVLSLRDDLKKIVVWQEKKQSPR